MALFKKFYFDIKSKTKDEEILSIVENLNNILNTKKGYGAILDDFGIYDMNEYSSSDDISRKIIEEVKQNIEQYEPRLKFINMSVKKDDNLFRLFFEIECMVRESKKSLHMEFNPVFNNFHVAGTVD